MSSGLFKIEPVVQPHERWIRKPTNIVIAIWLILSLMLPIIGDELGTFSRVHQSVIEHGVVDFIYPNIWNDSGLFQIGAPDIADRFRELSLDLVFITFVASVLIVFLQTGYSVLNWAKLSKIDLFMAVKIVLLALLTCTVFWLPFSDVLPGYSVFHNNLNASRSFSLPFSTYSTYLFTSAYFFILVLLGSATDITCRASAYWIQKGTRGTDAK